MRDLQFLKTSITLCCALALAGPAWAEETVEAETTPAAEETTEAAAVDSTEVAAPAEAEAEKKEAAESEKKDEEKEDEEAPASEAAATEAAAPEAIETATETIETAPEATETANTEGEAVAVETVEATVDQAPAPESEKVAAETVAETDDEEDKKPWGVNVGVGTSMSMMLFHPTRHVRSSLATFVPSISVGGNYKLLDKVMASANWGFSYELTTPNGSSASNFARRFRESDPTFGLSHSSLYKDEKLTGINIAGSASLGLGLSRMSITATQLFSLGASVSASRSFLDDKLSTSLSLTGGLPFHRYDSPVVRQDSRDDTWRCIVREGGNESVSDAQCATGSNNGMANMGLSLGVSYQFSDKVSGMLNFGLSKGYGYPIPVDEFSSQETDLNGDLIVDSSVVGRDSMMGGLGLSYSLPGKYMLSANLMTGGPLFRYLGEDLTQSNRVLRFPFWDNSYARTSFSLRVGRSF